jgi:hypothetical protein
MKVYEDYQKLTKFAKILGREIRHLWGVAPSSVQLILKIALPLILMGVLAQFSALVLVVAAAVRTLGS